ncbi:DUF6056 family protein [uncultured Desulfovibrio sp.]|uniref:DUF6056 family protein n=1 Tax=uncultured Desulfovibrio sp. TaxID=167968 RepID=UPI00262351D9|nr:DUF6056 family protein [uncultured Desulfovibrio sp.]
MKNNSGSLLIFGIILVAAVFFYFIWLTPYMTDNFIFSREIRPGYASFYTGEKISVSPMSIGGAFRQAWEMYFTWCGRFAGNLAVYLLFLLPRWLYCVFASLLFVFYLLLLQMCIFGREWRKNLSAGWLLGLAAIFWAGIPSFGEAFFWLSVGGQIALLGQALMLLPLRFALDDKACCNGCNRAAYGLKCIIYFIGGIIVASLDYPTSAVMPATAFVCTVWLYFRDRKSFPKIPWLALAGTVGLTVGAALTLLAPGNYQRMLLTNDRAVHDYLASGWSDRILSWLTSLPLAALMQFVPLTLLLWACYVLFRQYGNKWPRHIPAPALLFLFPAILTHGAYLFTAWPPPRAFATCFAQLTVCSCIVFVAAEKLASRKSWKFFQAGRLVLCLFCIFSLPYEAGKFRQLDAIVTERNKILSTAQTPEAVLPRIPYMGDKYLVLGKYLPDIGPDPDFWVNRAMSAYYGFDKVRVPPFDASYDGAAEALPTGRVFFSNGRLNALMADSSQKPQKLHVYYYGAPALLASLPPALGAKIFRWLSDARPHELKTLLVPILLARVDLKIGSAVNGEASGQSDYLKIINADHLWLVKPGEGARSFNLLPLKKISSPEKIKAGDSGKESMVSNRVDNPSLSGT